MRAKRAGRRQYAVAASLSGMMVMGLLAGCGSSSAGGTSGGTSGSTSSSNTAFSAAKGCNNVGVLLPESDTSARWVAQDTPLLKADIQKVLGSNGKLTLTNANNNANTQLQQAQSDLTKGACILVVAPVDANASAQIVAQAKANKVPVISYDRLIQSNDLAYYVSFDNVQVGKLQGQYIKDHYQSYVKAQGTNNTVMINGASTDNNALLFKQGALDVLQPLFDAKTLNLQYSQMTPAWNNDTAQNEMQAALTKTNNKVAVAYVANDGMAGTVIAALRQQHLNGKVLVTGQDATVDGIRNIILGDQMMTVYKAIGKEAQSTADIVQSLINGKTPTGVNGQTKLTSGNQVASVLLTPVAVDRSNIQSTVIKDGYVNKSDVCKGVPATADNGFCK